MFKAPICQRTSCHVEEVLYCALLLSVLLLFRLPAMVTDVKMTAKPAMRRVPKAAKTKSGQMSRSDPSQFSCAGLGLPFSSPFRVDAEATRSVLRRRVVVVRLCKKMLWYKIASTEKEG